MSVFAGFWIDGAVRQPEQRHADKEGCFVGRWKHRPGFDLLPRRFDRWHDVYWLDTTPRESLTPEELFSVVRVLWPRCNRVLHPSGASVGWQIEFDDTNEHTEISWGSLTQYPPPTQPEWIRITRENVGRYLFRECRCRINGTESWIYGHIVGWDIEDDCPLVDSDSNVNERVLKHDVVEVQA